MKTIITCILLCFLTQSHGQYLPTTYELDTSKSIIKWKGSYSFNFGEHPGIVQFESGELYTVNNKITGGDFTIDMTTIADDPEIDHQSPIKHLRNEDFFHVAKFPRARLVFKDVLYLEERNMHEITAELTIKGITKSQKFYATADAQTKTIKTKLKIDRTRWGIIYNHKLKDNAISDAIEFDVLLVFK